MLLIGLQQYDEALRNLRLSLVDQTIDFKSNTYSYLAMQTELLRELNHMQEFLQARHRIETIQDGWHRSCESQPIEIPAYVLETEEQMFRPGISTCAATLLICPDEANTSEHVTLLETMASQLKRFSIRCSNVREAEAPAEPNTRACGSAEALASRYTVLETGITDRMDSNATNYEDAYVRGLLTYHEQYPWREVPMSLSEGRRAWVVDMSLDRVFLPDGFLSGNIVRCWTALAKGGPHVWLCDDALDSSSLDESQQLSACC
jgi:hypothetical protein